MNINDRRYPWFALALLWVAFFLQQGTRQLFGPAIPAICSSLLPDVTLDKAKVSIGIVGTVFSMAYGICVPFAGIISDWFSRKWMVTIGVAIFSAGIFFSGAAASLGALVIFYGLLNGGGQTLYYPGATSLIAQLHPNSRATAMSILQLGLYLGIVGCGTLSGLVAGQGGENWRYPFYLFGALGLVWAVLLAVFLRNTPPAAKVVPAADAAVKSSSRHPILALTPICIILGLAMWVYVDIGFKIWMPAFLRERFLDSTPSLARWFGLHSVLWHYLGAVVGILIGSRLGDRLVAKRRTIRLEIQVLGLALGAPFIIGMSYASTFVGCCAAMLLFGFFRGIYDSNFVASFFEAIPASFHASGIGIMMCVAFLFGSLSSTVLPIISRFAGGNSSLSMASLAVFYLIGAGILFLARIRR